MEDAVNIAFYSEADVEPYVYKCVMKIHNGKYSALHLIAFLQQA